MINEYELANGPIKYPDDVVLIDYKWMSLHFDNSQSEAITFISEKIKDYTTKNFQLQGINFFNNSQNKAIKEIIEGASSNILRKLIPFKI